MQSPQFIVLVTTFLVSSVIMLDSNIVAVSLPAIGRSLGASFTDIQWVISAYVLIYAALLLAARNYADLHGRRKAMLIGLIVFAVASVVCGVATTSIILALARGVQGVGGALLLTASLAIISHEFAGEKRAGALAFWGASLGIALALGPIVGGAITNFFGWRWVFLVNVPACAVLIALTLKVVGESRDPEAKQLDFSGIISFSLGLGLLVWALIDGNDAGWSSAGVLGRTGAAALCFAGAWRDIQSRDPLFRSRTSYGRPRYLSGGQPYFLGSCTGAAPIQLVRRRDACLGLRCGSPQRPDRESFERLRPAGSRRYGLGTGQHDPVHRHSGERRGHGRRSDQRDASHVWQRRSSGRSRSLRRRRSGKACRGGGAVWGA